MEKAIQIFTRIGNGIIGFIQWGGEQIAAPFIRSVSEKLLLRPDIDFAVFCVLVFLLIIFLLYKSIVKKNTEKEKKFPELDKLKNVQIESKLNDKGKTQLAILRLFVIIIIAIVGVAIIAVKGGFDTLLME